MNFDRIDLSIMKKQKGVVSIESLFKANGTFINYAGFSVFRNVISMGQSTKGEYI
jgi:hypothetical protein